MQLPLRVMYVAGLTLGLAGAALAHHSAATFDIDHLATLEGTVKQVNWVNPHPSFVVEKDAKEGEQPITWVFESASPGVLGRAGWTKRSLQPGDHAMFRYAPHRAGDPVGILIEVMLPSGQKLNYNITPGSATFNTPDQPADK